MKLVEATDPILLREAEPVNLTDPSVSQIAADMMKLMIASSGCGLAAPQVGISLRMFVYNVGSTSGVVINPMILPIGDLIDCREGCLSYPGKAYLTKRASSIWCSWFNADGTRSGLQKFDGFLAIIFQHENDHLKGRVLPHHGIEE